MGFDSYIIVKGARVNNLKNINVEIPRDRLVVVTGLSGSGKSSLAFDTLYAEGQRRYVESLSSYARQFLGRMGKPEVDFIQGIPPAVAIEQRVNIRNPRSTVGTATEVYDYMRMLFARVGKVVSPVSGETVRKHQVSDVVDAILSYDAGTRISVLARVVPSASRSMGEELEMRLKEGFSRVEIDGEVYHIDGEELARRGISSDDRVFLLIDRVVVSSDEQVVARMADSVETAFYEGIGDCVIRVETDGGVCSREFSRRFEADGVAFEEPSDWMFNFNSPAGACPVCEGFGRTVGISESLVVPDVSLSVYEDAVACWRGNKMSEWKREFIHAASVYHFPVHRPYCELSEVEKELLWHGKGTVRGIDDFFRFVEENFYKIQYRIMHARFRGKTVCPACRGLRLKPQALLVKLGGKNIAELTQMPVDRLRKFFDELILDEHEAEVARRLLTEIRTRLQFLEDVGLGYVSLDRSSATLSGGESQRINLATSLGSSLVGSLYILDEPSIGLHSKDTARLIGVLRRLQALGNTVVVVEHNEEIIRAADYVIDIGPEAGRNGGKVVYQGVISDGKFETQGQKSYTLDYLTGKESIKVPMQRRKWSSYIEVIGARENNLKNINVRFPLHAMTVVTGVSGSGKSSLVHDVLYSNLRQYFDSSSSPSAPPARGNKTLGGDLQAIEQVVFVDQNPARQSSRSNPVTYIKAYDEVRKLFADQALAKQMRFSPAFFSFNVEGGRCEECKGEGVITVEMQFMADVVLECEACHGHRFSSDVLEVQYRGKNIYDVLEMTVEEAVLFFGEQKNSQTKKIVKKLKTLQDVGLGYVKLGQSSLTLSGGENQRVKLAYHLSEERAQPTLFIFDEPTTGLHFHDINTLMKSFDALIARGHSIIVIEHNLDVIKMADCVIDLGPGSGDEGGYLVAAGTPEEVAANDKSVTGKFLREKLKPSSEA
jgi:excinuclease ABC subunit A